MAKAAKKAADLGSAEGHPVLSQAVTVPSLSGGINNPVAIEPAEFSDSEWSYLVVRVRTKQTMYPRVRDDDGDVEGVQQVFVLEASGCVKINNAAIAGALQRHVDAVRAAEALAKKGQGSLGFDVDVDADDLPDPSELPEGRKRRGEASALADGVDAAVPPGRVADLEAEARARGRRGSPGRNFEKPGRRT